MTGNITYDNTYDNTTTGSYGYNMITTNATSASIWENYDKIKTIFRIQNPWTGCSNCTSSTSTNYIDAWETASAAYTFAWKEYDAFGRNGEYSQTYGKTKTPSERLREIIQKRQAPLIICTRKPLEPTQSPEEVRARETLKRVLGEDKFRSFLKNGFVSVQAKSGLIYQIYPGHGITAVYRDGEMTERLCVCLRGKFPPTDSLIMRYLLILNDERDFRSYANVFQAIQKKVPKTANQTPLTDIFRGLKVA